MLTFRKFERKYFLSIRFNPEEFPIEDCDKKARLQRALEIAEGVEPPPGFMSSTAQNPNATAQLPASTVASTGPVIDTMANVTPEATSATPAEQQWHMVCSNSAALRFMLPNLLQHPDDIRIHSQVNLSSLLLQSFRAAILLDNRNIYLIIGSIDILTTG